MNAAPSFAGYMKKHVLGQTPLIVHRPPVHDALRRHGVEPLFTR